MRLTDHRRVILHILGRRYDGCVDIGNDVTPSNLDLAVLDEADRAGNRNNHTVSAGNVVLGGNVEGDKLTLCICGEADVQSLKGRNDHIHHCFQLRLLLGHYERVEGCIRKHTAEDLIEHLGVIFLLEQEHTDHKLTVIGIFDHFADVKACGCAHHSAKLVDLCDQSFVVKALRCNEVGDLGKLHCKQTVDAFLQVCVCVLTEVEVDQLCHGKGCKIFIQSVKLFIVQGEYVAAVRLFRREDHSEESFKDLLCAICIGCKERIHRGNQRFKHEADHHADHCLVHSGHHFGRGSIGIAAVHVDRVTDRRHGAAAHIAAAHVFHGACYAVDHCGNCIRNAVLHLHFLGAGEGVTGNDRIDVIAVDHSLESHGRVFVFDRAVEDHDRALGGTAELTVLNIEHKLCKIYRDLALKLAILFNLKNEVLDKKGEAVNVLIGFNERYVEALACLCAASGANAHHEAMLGLCYLLGLYVAAILTNVGKLTFLLTGCDLGYDRRAEFVFGLVRLCAALTAHPVGFFIVSVDHVAELVRVNALEDHGLNEVFLCLAVYRHTNEILFLTRNGTACLDLLLYNLFGSEGRYHLGVAVRAVQRKFKRLCGIPVLVRIRIINVIVCKRCGVGIYVRIVTVYAVVRGISARGAGGIGDLFCKIVGQLRQSLGVGMIFIVCTYVGNRSCRRTGRILAAALIPSVLECGKGLGVRMIASAKR